MGRALRQHDELLRGLVRSHGGVVFKTVGDGICAAFASPGEAVATALEAQGALRDDRWPMHLSVRMAIHTGYSDPVDGDYLGPAPNRCSRLLALAHGGQILLSQATQQMVADELPAGAELIDLGEHRLRDLRRPERVFQLSHSSLPADFPPLRTPDARPHNLPAELSELVGRDQEVEQVRALLQRGRMVTITGPGGVGKTRLALAVGLEESRDFAGRIRLVEMARLTHPRSVLPAIAQSVDVTEERGVPLEQAIAAALTGSPTLLVVDNCEHLVEAIAAALGTLLGALPELKVLATSRQLLGVAGEIAYRLAPLAVPEGPTDLHEPVDFPGVRLFIERARAARPDLELLPEEQQAVFEICRRLDGLPLALELAAGLLRLLPPSELARRLDDPLRTLDAGRLDAGERHRSLEAAISWSYQSLSEEGRRAFRRLSIFSGTFNLTDAERMLSQVAQSSTLELVGRLVDTSLISPVPSSAEARFRMLDTLRHFGREQLHAEGELIDAWLALGDLVGEVFTEASRHVSAVDEQKWMERLDLLYDDARATLRWAFDSAQGTQLGVRLAGLLGKYWWVRGFFTEGRAWLSEALLRAEPGSVERAEVLRSLAWLLLKSGETEQAEAYAHEALTLFEELGKDEEAGAILNTLGAAASERGESEAALAHYDRAIEKLNALGLPAHVPLLNSAYDALNLGDLDDAAERLRRAAADKGDTQGGIDAVQGVLHYARGELDEATERLERAYLYFTSINHAEFIGVGAAWLLEVMAFGRLDSTRTEELLAVIEDAAAATGAPHLRIWLHQLRGLADLRQGAPDRTEGHLEEAIGECERLGHHGEKGITLAFLALAASTQGDRERALEHARACNEALSKSRWVLPKPIEAELKQVLGTQVGG